jgi:hypothetical protein
LARTSTTAAPSSGRVARFGVPAVITSNRGVPFASLLWAALCALLSVQHAQNNANTLQSSSIVECLHRCLKKVPQARGAAADWLAHLPRVLLDRAAAKKAGDKSPDELLYASQLVLSAEIVTAADPLLPEKFLSC